MKIQFNTIIMKSRPANNDDDAGDLNEFQGRSKTRDDDDDNDDDNEIESVRSEVQISYGDKPSETRHTGSITMESIGSLEVE